MWIAVLDTLFFVVCFSEEPSGVADDVNNDNGNGNNEGVRSQETGEGEGTGCLLYTSPSPRDEESSRMPSSA